jgi:hypothetical protein
MDLVEVGQREAAIVAMRAPPFLNSILFGELPVPNVTLAAWTSE